MNPVYNFTQVSLRPITVSSFCLNAGLASDYFLNIFVLTFWYAFPVTPVTATCSRDLSLLVLCPVIILGEKYNLCKSSFSNFLQLSLILLVEIILLKTFFSNRPSLLSSARIKDQVSHSYKATGKVWFCVYQTLRFHKEYTLRKFSNSPRLIIQVPT